ncbi:MAG: CapA family protein [Thermoguttaceae bacterium]|jgi:poly-gamma-glutamate synthesis protein (capsule biosynthesis protein)
MSRRSLDLNPLFIAALRTIAICFLLPAVVGSNAARAADDWPKTVRLVFAGDVMLDGGPGHALVHGTDPFAEFASIFHKADIAVCNLECAVVEGGEQVLKPYTFRGPPGSIPLLKKYFSAINLANNHSCDFGKAAFLDQLALLKKAELPCFGGGRNSQEAYRPLILDRNGLRIALLGFNRFPPKSFAAGQEEPGVAWLDEPDVVKAIKSAREEHHADIVIPYLHWGKEDTPGPTTEQKELARRLIDAGANAIIGTHPHVIQTVDIYKGCPIVYSLGNMVFDYYPVDPEVWTGWIVELSFSRPSDDKPLEAGMETYVLQIDKAGIPHLMPLPEAETPAEK